MNSTKKKREFYQKVTKKTNLLNKNILRLALVCLNSQQFYTKIKVWLA